MAAAELFTEMPGPPVIAAIVLGELPGLDLPIFEAPMNLAVFELPAGVELTPRRPPIDLRRAIRHSFR